jgi:hypothetical protein
MLFGRMNYEFRIYKNDEVFTLINQMKNESSYIIFSSGQLSTFDDEIYLCSNEKENRYKLIKNLLNHSSSFMKNKHK